LHPSQKKSTLTHTDEIEREREERDDFGERAAVGEEKGVSGEAAPGISAFGSASKESEMLVDFSLPRDVLCRC